MSSAEKRKRFEKHLAAIKQHKLEEALEIYDKNYQVTVGDKVVVNGIDEMKSFLVKKFADPNYSHEIIEYLPSESDDQIRVHLKSNLNKHFDDTYVFSKENPLKLLRASITPIDG